MYYTANEYQAWESTKAKTLSGAKRVAAKRNPYAEKKTVHVGVIVDYGYIERIESIATRRHGIWVDMYQG